MPEQTRDRKRRDDGGFTLVELLVVMVVMIIALVAVWEAVIQVHLATRETQQRADAVAEARLAMQQIDRQVRSGNVISDPATEVLPLSLRVYTQVNGTKRCMQWHLQDDPARPGQKVLRTRDWSRDWQVDGDVSAWHVVARGLVNDAAEPPFLMSDKATYGERLIDVRLLVEPERGGRPVAIESSLSGRNTHYGYDPGTCTPVPAA